MISKQTIGSHLDIESMMLIRERLVSLSLHHVDIFGELESLQTTKYHFVFKFKFVPSVSIKELAQSNLNEAQRRFLTDQIWLFLDNLRSNNY